MAPTPALYNSSASLRWQLLCAFGGGEADDAHLLGAGPAAVV
jgi:hypothetical protein